MSAVNLIRKNQVGEQRPFMEFQRFVLFLLDDSDKVHRFKIRRKLNSAETGA
jgi:hypothetical protein